MPRTIDPAGISVGVGTAAPGSVEDSSLRNPTRDTRPLDAHIKDPSRAHMAATTGIVDAGDYYASDEVEGALQEIGGGFSGGRTNGLLSGGTWTRVGNVLTMDATTVLVGGVLVDIGGDTITLADGVRWVYVDASTRALASSASAPNLVDEPVLISKVTTVAGTIDTGASLDARFFVAQIDRKPPLTLRDSGAAGNANAEGCFYTMEAALLYLETYAGTGDSQAETQTIVVRGEITLSTTVTLPVPGIKFIGDGPDSGFVTGATVTPMFNLNGQSRTSFERLKFLANNTGSTAIADTNQCLDLKVEGCRFVGGTQEWAEAIDLSHNGAANTRVVLRDLYIEATTIGLTLNRPNDCQLDNIVVAEQGSSGTHGLRVNESGPYAGEGHTNISNCKVTGFGIGIRVAGDDSTVEGCSLRECAEGIEHGGGEVSISNCSVNLSGTTGVNGIRVAGTSEITGCSVVCSRTVWGGEVPQGILIAGNTSKVRVSSCTVSGFDNAGAGAGVGVSPESLFISIEGSDFLGCGKGVFVGLGCSDITISGNTTDDCTFGISVEGVDAINERTTRLAITGNTVRGSEDAGIFLYGYIRNVAVTGNVVDGLLLSAPLEPTSVGILIRSKDSNLPDYITISDNVVLRAREGIVARGTDTSLQVSHLKIQGNTIHHCAFHEDISGVVNTYDGRGSKGIGLEYCDAPEVIGNALDKIGSGITVSGVEAFPSGGGTDRDVQSRGIYARNCNAVRVAGNTVRNCVANDHNGSGFVLPYGIFIEVNSVGTGADFTVRDYSVSENEVLWDSALPGTPGGGEFGIAIEITQGTDVNTNSLENARSSGNRVFRCRRDGIRYATGGGARIVGAKLDNNYVELVCQVAQVGTTEQAAIHVVGQTGGNSPTSLAGLTVSGNTVEDSGFTSTTYGPGIQLYLERDGNLRDVLVSNNLVAKTRDEGIRMTCDTGISIGTSSLGSWVVTGNQVKGSSATGIYLRAPGTGSGANILTDLAVSSNYIEACAGAGINILAGQKVEGVHVSGNTGDGNGAWLVEVSAGTGSAGLSEGVVIQNNTHRGGSGVVVFNGTRTVQTVTIQGNTAQDFTSRGVWFICGGASSSISITDNNLRSNENNVLGIDFDLPNAAIAAVTIADNLVRLTGTGTRSMECNSVAGGTQEAVSVCGNTFYGAVNPVLASGAFAPQYGNVSTNIERTAGGAGGWAAFGAAFTAPTVVASNQD